MDQLQEPHYGRPQIPGTGGLTYYGHVLLDIEMRGEQMRSRLYVFDGLQTEIIIGLDWLQDWQCEISFAQNLLYISLNGVRVPFGVEPASEELEKSGEPDEGGSKDAGGKPAGRKGKGKGQGRPRTDQF